MNLPDVCAAFLQQVPVPAVTAKTDARVAFTKVDAALATANGRIAGGAGCLEDQRQAYAAPKEKPR